jgi:hypothetical protein
MDFGIEEIDLPDTASLKTTCRFCGRADKITRPINNLDELEMDLVTLMVFLELNIEFNQYLELICNDCFNQISSMDKFRVQCRAAESKLVSILGISIKSEEIKVEVLELEENFNVADSENENGLIDEDFSEDSDYKPIKLKKSTKHSKKISQSVKCDFCKKSVENLEDHDCPIKEIKCEECNEEFSMSDFKKHKKFHKNDKKSTECKICHKSFPTYRGLSNHKLAHRRRDVEGFVPKKRPEAMCELCGIKFQTPSGLIKHNQTKHLVGGQVFPCDECPKKFQNQIALKSHKSNTHKIENATCVVCGKTYKNRMLLRLHSRFHDESKRIFKCEYCPGKGFFTKSDLKKHIRSHFGDKPYSCVLCEKRYA